MGGGVLSNMMIPSMVSVSVFRAGTILLSSISESKSKRERGLMSGGVLSNMSRWGMVEKGDQTKKGGEVVSGLGSSARRMTDNSKSLPCLDPE